MLSLAKNEYEVLTARSIGLGETEQVVRKEIDAQWCRMEMAKMEMERLQASLADSK